MLVLDPDRSVRLPAVTVIKASAGSGKTHTLTGRYVQFALSDLVPRNDIKGILAITFSNNASREMKESALGWLKRLFLEDPDRIEEMRTVVSGGTGFIQKRAGDLIEEILSRYSDFQVRTIDSFMSAVFRASALDFGFSPEFEIMMDPEPLTDYAFGLFLRDAREGSGRAAMLDETVGSILGLQAEGDRFPWDPTYPLLMELKRIDSKVSNLGKDIRLIDSSVELRGLEKAIGEKLEGIRSAMDASGLQPNGRSTFPAILASGRARRFKDLVGKGLKTPPVNKPKAGGAHKAYDAVLREWEEAAALIRRYSGLWARAYYLPYLRLHREVSTTVEAAKRTLGKVFIGDINAMLGGYLEAEIVPDVYFSIGEKIHHYLIDEFQDTSPIQWRNLFPLIENSLSEGGSLFVVGDTKQAIYGFRHADYGIMKGLEAENPFPSARHVVKDLSLNYRSKPRIVELTTRVFRDNAGSSTGYAEAAAATGLDSFEQKASPGDDEGYAEVRILKRNDEDPPERIAVQEIVSGLRDRGYRWGDIAILAPRNEDVLAAAAWLNEKDIPFISHSSLDVRERRIAGEIISLLGFLDSPPDDLSFATFILGELFSRLLSRRGWESSRPLHDFLFSQRENAPLYKAFQEAFPDLWDAYFSGPFRSAGYLPLYDLACEVFATFSPFNLAHEEEATLSKLLEAIKDFEGSGSNSLRDFLGSATDSSDETGMWEINVPPSVDSVRVMTVHKAKGLGFPAVIALLYGERNRGFEHAVLEEDGGAAIVKLTRETAACDPALSELYDRESLKEKTNRLNSLYVALTRAKSEMYVIGVKGKGDAYPFDLLPDAGFEPSPRKGAARSEGPLMESGTALSHAPRTVPASRGRGRLALEERRRGEIAHRILSMIPYLGEDPEKEVDRAARRAAAESRLPEPDPELTSALARMIKGPQLLPYFTQKPDRRILTEQELCDRDGRLLRADRVVVDPGLITVLDFKTGAAAEHEQAHEEQIRSYARILSDVFPAKRIEALLAYVDTGTVRRVP
jgi:ATP-dependent helicase/nuclease subunit A